MLIIGKTWSKGEGKWELNAQFFCKSKTAKKKKKKKHLKIPSFSPSEKRGGGKKYNEIPKEWSYEVLARMLCNENVHSAGKNVKCPMV